MKRLAILSIALVLTGCASTRRQVARDLTVMNEPQEFSLHIGSVQNFSHRLTYSWENKGTRATVRQAASLNDGVANLNIRDPGGLLVHSKTLREVGSFETFEGKPGIWKIHVTLDHASGSVTFEVRPKG